MSVAVYKYLLRPDGHVRMPIGAKLLHVGEQRGEAYVWALVNTEMNDTMRVLRVLGTGHDADGVGEFVGTFMMDGGALVFHVFDQGEVGL